MKLLIRIERFNLYIQRRGQTSVCRYNTNFFKGGTMRSSRVILACAIVTVLFLSVGIALSQPADKAVTIKGDKAVTVKGDKTVTVAGILKQAKCPLTEAQAKQLKDLDLSTGREAYQTLNTMFDETQLAALKKALGTSPGRSGGPETPRYLRQVVVFEKAGCPLMGTQLTALLALEPGQGSREQMNTILTDPQKEAMAKMMPRRSP